MARDETARDPGFEQSFDCPSHRRPAETTHAEARATSDSSEGDYPVDAETGGRAVRGVQNGSE